MQRGAVAFPPTGLAWLGGTGDEPGRGISVAQACGEEKREGNCNTVIKYLKELLRRKDLLIYLVISGLKAQYRNTFLGYFWWILDPLLMGAVYYFLRVVILEMEGDNIGVFLIIGLLSWQWLKSTINASAKSISGKARIITQVYLPKAIFPFGVTLTQLINFTFGLVVVAIFMALYGVVPGTEALWLPFIMLIQFVFLTAISLVVAYLCMFIRDIDNALTHLTRLWFWTSPVIWESARLPDGYEFILDINPVAILLISYRNVLMYGTGPELQKLIIMGVVSLAVILYMVYYYHVNEHKIIRAL